MMKVSIRHRPGTGGNVDESVNHASRDASGNRWGAGGKTKGERRIPGCECQPEGKQFRARNQGCGERRQPDGIANRSSIERLAGMSGFRILAIRCIHVEGCKRPMIDAMGLANPLREQQRRRQHDCGGETKLQGCSQGVHGNYFTDTGAASVRR